MTAAVRDAIVDWPEFYNAGTIGPDAFPDLVFGQSKIHPESIGLWLRQIFHRGVGRPDRHRLQLDRALTDPRLRLRLPSPTPR